MKRLYLVLMSVMFVLCAIAQNQRTVTGTVVFEGDNEPLIGATVMPASGTTGVITNSDGQFTLRVPRSVKTIRVSYVGMVTRELEITDAPMLIKLSSADNTLDEVVVTAFGMKKERKGLGYAVQDLKAEDLNTDGTTSLAKIGRAHV